MCRRANLLRIRALQSRFRSFRRVPDALPCSQRQNIPPYPVSGYFLPHFCIDSTNAVLISSSVFPIADNSASAAVITESSVSSEYLLKSWNSFSSDFCQTHMGFQSCRPGMLRSFFVASFALDGISINERKKEVVVCQTTNQPLPFYSLRIGCLYLNRAALISKMSYMPWDTKYVTIRSNLLLGEKAISNRDSRSGVVVMFNCKANGESHCSFLLWLVDWQRGFFMLCMITSYAYRVDGSEMLKKRIKFSGTWMSLLSLRKGNPRMNSYVILESRFQYVSDKQTLFFLYGKSESAGSRACC